MSNWPALPYEGWKDTYATLHMWSQVVGKVALKPRPHVLAKALFLLGEIEVHRITRMSTWPASRMRPPIMRIHTARSSGGDP